MTASPAQSSNLEVAARKVNRIIAFNFLIYFVIHALSSLSMSVSSVVGLEQTRSSRETIQLLFVKEIGSIFCHYAGTDESRPTSTIILRKKRGILPEKDPLKRLQNQEKAILPFKYVFVDTQARVSVTPSHKFKSRDASTLHAGLSPPTV